MNTNKSTKVFSPSNIALAKYWGKRNVELNLPANGSISITLKDFGSTTEVRFSNSLEKDIFFLNEKEESGTKLKKIQKPLDILRTIAGVQTKAEIHSKNNFPTGAGLASSASGISALVMSAARALNLDLPVKKLSEIARIGSGSACRSFFGGFVEWQRGELSDGSDSIGVPLFSTNHWKLSTLIAVTNENAKKNPSTNAMEHTRLTSPYYSSWVENAQKSLKEFKTAIEDKDFLKLAQLAESNCMQMHASSMAAVPPILYWSAATVDVMTQVWELRENKGIPVFFTIDAGPNVVLVCPPEQVENVTNHFSAFSNRVNFMKTTIGEGARYEH